MSKRLNSLLKIFDKDSLERDLLLTVKKIFNHVKSNGVVVSAAYIIILAVCKQVLACLRDIESGKVDNMLEDALDEEYAEEEVDVEEEDEDEEEEYDEDVPTKKVVRRKARKAKPLNPEDLTATGRPKSKYDKKIKPKKSPIAVMPHGGM